MMSGSSLLTVQMLMEWDFDAGAIDSLWWR